MIPIQLGRFPSRNSISCRISYEENWVRSVRNWHQSVDLDYVQSSLDRTGPTSIDAVQMVEIYDRFLRSVARYEASSLQWDCHDVFSTTPWKHLDSLSISSDWDNLLTKVPKRNLHLSSSSTRSASVSWPKQYASTTCMKYHLSASSLLVHLKEQTWSSVSEMQVFTYRIHSRADRNENAEETESDHRVSQPATGQQHRVRSVKGEDR